jgi:multidrug transporter EmrE-like cation transporter
VAPSLPVFGATFPDWLFCIIAGVILTIIAHFVLKAMHRVSQLKPLALSYPGLTASFSVLIWLIVFYP